MLGLHTKKLINKEDIYLLQDIFYSIKQYNHSNIAFERFYEKYEDNIRVYDVYKVICNDNTYILKKSDKYEISIYKNFLTNNNLPSPNLEGYILYENSYWILVEYICGSDLRNIDESKTIQAAESISIIFNKFWKTNNISSSTRFNRYLARINKRALCLLNDHIINSAYNVFIARQLSAPLTLCNGDLLQFNTIQRSDKVIIIDWAFGGLLPYSLDIARFISHGSKHYFPFPFYITNKERLLFLETIFRNISLEIDYTDFLWDILLSSLNECVEFIEAELNDLSIIRDDGFYYYYKTALNLSNVILKGKKSLVIDDLLLAFDNNLLNDLK